MSEIKDIQVSFGRGFMTPTSVKEGMELAGWIAKSDLAPRDYKDKPQNVLIAMQMGLEVGLSPMQAIQNIAVINGRPSIWGDAMLALVQSHRDFESIDENLSTSTVGVSIVKRRGMEPQRREFSVEDAKKAGLFGKPGPWQTATARMLKLRARAFALRDTFADALRGLQSAEEERDSIETTATVETARPEHVEMPKRVSATVEPTAVAVTSEVVQPKAVETKIPDVSVKRITLPQQKRFFAIAKGAGKSDAEIKSYLATLGIQRSSEISVDSYDAACEWASRANGEGLKNEIDVATGEIVGDAQEPDEAGSV